VENHSFLFSISSLGGSNLFAMAESTVDVEVAPRVQIAKKSIWQSIFDNPKVIFIAFFAS
jgi:hypothetical protein